MSRFPNRRDLLISCLGLPAAFVSCNSRLVNSLPAGEIVGASNAVGHLLRSDPPRRPSGKHWQEAGVVIVGGGVAGLSAAWRLKQTGFEDFILLELENEPGGTSRSGRSQLVDFPWGAHYLPAPMAENRPLIDLLEEMALIEGYDSNGDPLIAEQFLCRDPQERLFYQGFWYEDLYLAKGATDEDTKQVVAFDREIDGWVQWRDGQGRRAFSIPMCTGSDDAEVTALDRISMAEWMDQRSFTSPRLRWAVGYACRDDYGMTMEQTSAWAGLFYFSARKRQADARSRPYITWPEGNGRLVRHLYDTVKPHVRLGSAVVNLENVVDDSRRKVDVVLFDTASGAFRGIHADQVVFAAPHFLTRYMIESYRSDTPRHVGEFEYGSWMVANLFVHDRPESQGFPMAWDNVFYDSSSLGYVPATHQAGLDYGPTVLTYYYALSDQDPHKARKRLLDLEWADWAEIALADIAQAHPNIRSLVDRLDVMRWGHAMIRPRVGFIWGGTRQAAMKPHGNIHFAHSDLSGLALFEEAFAHGIRAADEILDGASPAEAD